MILGVFVLPDSPTSGRISSDGRRWTKRILAVYFVLFLLFLYGPMIVMAALSFQGRRAR